MKRRGIWLGGVHGVERDVVIKEEREWLVGQWVEERNGDVSFNDRRWVSMKDKMLNGCQLCFEFRK